MSVFGCEIKLFYWDWHVEKFFLKFQFRKNGVVCVVAN